MYCFHCFLYGGEDMWTKTGVRDINHLAFKAKHQENTKVHMKNALNLSMFGKLLIAKLDSEYRKSIHNHNELVKKGRYISNVI